LKVTHVAMDGHPVWSARSTGGARSVEPQMVRVVDRSCGRQVVTVDQVIGQKTVVLAVRGGSCVRLLNGHSRDTRFCFRTAKKRCPRRGAR
jgi:hypothetical protein